MKRKAAQPRFPAFLIGLRSRQADDEAIRGFSHVFDFEAASSERRKPPA